jgi:hypothetical protein
MAGSVRLRAVLAASIAAMLFVGVGGRRIRAAGDTLPAELSDQELWRLSADMSEANGYFRSDNLLSNEIWYPDVMPDLLRQAKQSEVYLGVGPEQNFNYIVQLHPKMVFITDIRRGNLHSQLMYKALFEMSSDRADFVGKLFSKPRPAGLTAKSSAAEIMDAYWNVPTSAEAVYKQNLQAIDDYLTKNPHHLPLDKDDLDGIEYVYYSFYWFGPSINYNSSTNSMGGRGGNMTDYRDLMKASDNKGTEWSFLANETTFSVMKDLESHNLLVPVVGNFGGPKALRAVGQYVRDHQSMVSAFYLSNVEQYLRQDAIWGNFCQNVASMPLDESSTFIRSGQGGFGFGGGGGGLRNSLGNMKEETQNCGN